MGGLSNSGFGGFHFPKPEEINPPVTPVTTTGTTGLKGALGALSDYIKKPVITASEEIVTGDLSKPPLGAPMSQINQGMDWAKNQFSNWFTNQGNIQKALDQIYSGYRDRLQGYDAPTMQAMRKQAGDVINGQAQTGMRLAGSRNASSGIRGAAANAANLQIADKASQARAAAENELIVKNDAVRRQALKDFDSMVTSERAGVLSSIMGGADMYNKVLAHDDMMKLLSGYQADAAKKAAEAQAAADGEFSGWKNQINKLLPTYFGGDRAVLPALDPLTAAHFQQWGWIGPQGEAFPETQNIGGNYNILSGLGI